MDIQTFIQVNRMEKMRMRIMQCSTLSMKMEHGMMGISMEERLKPEIHSCVSGDVVRKQENEK